MANWDEWPEERDKGTEMRILRAMAVVLCLPVALPGCSWLGFGDDEPEPSAEAPAAPEVQPEIVQSVRKLEIGRTRDGVMLTAYGTGTGLGYSLPRLRARRDGKPGPDGMIDYDFIANPPDPGFNLGTGTVKARALRADLPVKVTELEGARGIRVHGRERGVQILF